MMPIKWSNSASDDDVQDARNFLFLIGMDWRAGGLSITIPAKDILRASSLLTSVLPKDNAGVKKYLDRFKKGETISRVLLVVGQETKPLIVAEGFHRVCAAWWTEEATPVAAILGPRVLVPMELK